jgi:hypothetical protein
MDKRAAPCVARFIRPKAAPLHRRPALKLAMRSRNASAFSVIAFSSEVDSGSRQEKASKQKHGASFLIPSETTRF